MPSSSKRVLVVGATGATGKHVVQMLLDQGQTVVAVARSEEKMKSLLRQEDYGDKLIVRELSLSDLTPQQFQELTQGCDAVVRYVQEWNGMFDVVKDSGHEQLTPSSSFALAAALDTT